MLVVIVAGDGNLHLGHDLRSEENMHKIILRDKAPYFYTKTTD